MRFIQWMSIYHTEYIRMILICDLSKFLCTGLLYIRIYVSLVIGTQKAKCRKCSVPISDIILFDVSAFINCVFVIHKL